MRLFINNLTPEYPDPEDEAYWDFMADSLNMRRYDDEGTRPNSIDLTMTTQQGARTHTTQVVSFRAPHNGKPPVLEIHCDAAQAGILAEWLEMMGAVIRHIPKELHSEEQAWRSNRTGHGAHDKRHPVENVMPDSSGIWQDRRGNVWLIDDTLHGYVFKRGGCWTTRLVGGNPEWYADDAPFTKLAITENEPERNRHVAETPDSAGLWKDSNGCIWVVDEILFAMRIRTAAGEWRLRPLQRPARILMDHAPFTKLPITEEGISS